MDSIEYRPGVGPGLAVSGIWFATAGLVAWLGLILGPEDRAAMDGFALLLFTAIPIRLFSWTMAPLLAALGVYFVRRSLGGPPSLAVSPEGLSLRSGRRIPWTEIASVQVTKEGHLVIDVEVPGSSGVSTRTWSWLKPFHRAASGRRVSLSPFDLGCGAEEVATEVGRRMVDLTSAGGEV